MPFAPDTKARMFVRCARICCLCLKQCGTNIEAAHIIAEADGGPNSEDNGIPACMDCHTEISHYDPRQPKGNKFSREELRARRDHVYKLVDSGALFAQVIALRSAVGSPNVRTPISDSAPSLSEDSKGLIEAVKAGNVQGGRFPAKLQALSSDQRALIIDVLVKECDDKDAMAALGAVVKDSQTSANEKLVLAEQLLRKVTVSTDPDLKAEFLKSLPVDLIRSLDITLREAFFKDIIALINADQFEEVNAVVPALDGMLTALPPSLAGELVDALVDQAGSDAWRGAPAAKRLLETLPDELVVPALEAMTLSWRNSTRREVVESFLRKRRAKWPSSRAKMLNDYLRLKWETFVRRHGDPDA